MERSPTKEDVSRLLDAAQQARKRAYAPFSRFKVGAAVLTRSGRIISGCNVENSSYGLTICAERVALFTAIADGEREFAAIAVAAATKTLIPPCGACRQVISDLAGNIPVYIMNAKGKRQTYDLKTLLPKAFGPHHLKS